MFTTTLGRITVFFVVSATFGLGMLLIAAWTVKDAFEYSPQLRVGLLDVSDTTATAVMVFDVDSGTEIASKNSTQALPIASVTKLVTAAIFYRGADLSGTTTITWADVNTYGDAGRIHAYEEYSNRELLFPLLLESSNDAASAMLRVYPELLSEANAYVQELGLTQTLFEDPSGLSEQNVSTAYELSLLARDIFLRHSHIIDITRLPQYIGTHTGWLNNNPLITEDGYFGGKHGFTEAANRTTVAFFKETLASGHTRTIGYVILGSQNVPNDVLLLREQVQKNVYLE